MRRLKMNKKAQYYQPAPKRPPSPLLYMGTILLVTPYIGQAFGGQGWIASKWISVIGVIFLLLGIVMSVLDAMD